MSLAERLARIAVESSAALNPGAFYASAAGLSAGAGLLYADVPYSFFDPAADEFVLMDGPVIVLTHECDIDQSNTRHFNDRAIVCPILLLQAFATLKQSAGEEPEAESMVRDIAANRVSRVFLLPRPLGPMPYPEIQFGGLLYLNMLTNVHVKHLSEHGRPICSLSQYALQMLDMKLQHHLFRPKAEMLPRLQ